TRLAAGLETLGFRRWFGAAPPDAATADDGEHAGGDLFLLGVSREGLALIQHLERTAPATKARIVAIDFNPEMLERIAQHGVAHHYGDIANMATLEHAGIGRAAVVISGISDWFLKGTSNLQVLQTVRATASAARVIVTADTAEAAQQLYAAGAD